MKVMNKRLLIFTLFITCVYTTSLFAQDRLGVYAAAFYNLENLWDTVDDPNNEGDDDFTPEGKYEWTQTKYEQKFDTVLAMPKSPIRYLAMKNARKLKKAAQITA